MKKTTFSIAVAALAIASGFAQAGQLADNYIKQQNLYEPSRNGTVLGVVVKVNGQKTLHQVGTAEGLTPSIVTARDGKAAEAWAREYLGVDVQAQLCPAGTNENGSGGGAPDFVSC